MSASLDLDTVVLAPWRTSSRVTALVDPRRVTRRQLVAALRRSSRGIAVLLELGCSRGGSIPPTKRYVWRNLPLDVGHVLAYFVAHEAHHRGRS